MIHSSKKPLLLLLLLSSTAISGAAFGAQVVPMRPDDSAIAKISIQSPTRIKSENGRLRGMSGNIWDKAENPDGDLIVLRNMKEGEMMVSLRPGAGPKAQSVFVHSETATYALVLQPVDIPSDTIVIREVGTPVRKASVDRSASPRNPDGGSPGSHERVVKEMIRVMASGKEGVPGTGERELNREMQLWEGTRFVLTRQLFVGSYVGEVYRITNTGASNIVMTEQEFYKPGLAGVAIKHHDLYPGQTSDIYTVRMRGDNE